MINKKERLKSMKSIMLQLVAIILITIVLGEVCFRLFKDNIDLKAPIQLKESSINYESSLFSIHLIVQKEQSITNKIQLIYKKDGTSFNPKYYLNNLGYRGRIFDKEKEEEVKRIIVYGGSAAFDMNATLNEDWPHLLEKYLTKEGAQKFEVINAGTPGHSTFDAMGKLFSEGHNFKPDYVILYNQWNDFKLFSSEKTLSRTVKPYIEKANPFIFHRNAFDQYLSNHSIMHLALRTVYYNHKIKVGPEGAIKDNIADFKINQSALDQFRLNIEMFIDCARNIGAEPILITQLNLIRPYNKRKDQYRLRHVKKFIPYNMAEKAIQITDKILKEVSQEKMHC